MNVMRKVKNKKVIRRLSRRGLAAGQKKNIIAVLGIMLTCILFTSLFSIGGSILKSSQESTMRQVGGSSMAGLKFALPQDFEKLSSDAAVRAPAYRILVGSAASKKLNKLATEVNYAQDADAKNMFSYPEEGQMPKKRLEAATSTLVLDALGIPHQIGEKIRLTFDSNGKKRTETFTLCGYWKGDSISMAQQFWVSKVYCDEITSVPSKPYKETDGFHSAGYWMIDFNYANSWDIEGKTIELLQRNGYDPEHTDYGINWAYTTSDVDAATVLLYTSLLIIVLLSGYLIIYNIFYINVARDLQYYGLLKTIGATGRQLKRLVRLQGYALALLGIPAGLVLGTMLSRALLPIIISNFDIGDMFFSVHPLIYLLSAAFSLITVLISCMKPCHMAAKVSPAEAVSYTGTLPVKKKRKKSRKTTALSMAWRNLGRNRKKVAVVIISICLSLLLVNGTFAITKGFDLDKYVGEQMTGDLMIGGASTFNHAAGGEIILDPIKKSDRQAFRTMDGVEQASDVYCSFGHIALKEKDYDHMMKFIADHPKIFNDDPWMESDFENVKNNKFLDCTIYGMDRYGTDQLVIKQGRIDQGAFESGDYVLLEDVVGNNTGNIAATDCYQAGDTVPLNLPDGSQKQYKVMAIVEIPTALTNQMGAALGTRAVIPSKEYLAHGETEGSLLSILTLAPDKADAVEKAVASYTEKGDSNLIYRSKHHYAEEFQGFIRMYHIVGAALSGILGLIGILNFSSVIVTGIYARRQEFAMMQAVGMDGKQLKGTLIWEGLLYALISLIVVLTLGSLTTWILVQAVAGEIWFFTYHFSVTPILLCAVPLLLITWLLPELAYRSLKKKTIVEQLRVSA